MKKAYFTIFVALASVTCGSFSDGLHAQEKSAQEVRVSSEAHNGSVNVFYALDDGSFFSAGEDGFLVKWATDGMGEHYQVSDLSIQAIAKNPASDDYALTETDGTFLYRVTVLDWKTLSKKYTKQFNEPILHVSYSSKGNLLFVCTQGINKSYILNAKTGMLLDTIDDINGRISCVKTAESEKLAILYTAGGTIYYYDIANKKLLPNASFACEENLTSAMILGSGKMTNRFLVGIKENKVYAIDVRSGKTFGTYTSLQTPVPVSSEDNKAFYILEADKKQFSILALTEDSLANSLSAQAKNQKLAFEKKHSVAGFSANTKISALGFNTKQNTVFFGTTPGSVYSMDKNDETVTLPSEITHSMYQEILDIACDDNQIYVLTSDGIYKTSYDGKEAQKVSQNYGNNSFIVKNGTAYLWNNKKTGAIQQASVGSETVATPKNLVESKKIIKKAHLFGNALVYVEGSSAVKSYDIKTKKTKTLYSGLALDDAVLMSNGTLYVAKASASEGDSPLISVNNSNGETVALKCEGFAAYSLSMTDSDSAKCIYGIKLKDEAGSTVTDLFSYNIKTKRFASLLTLNQEDTKAFTAVEYPSVFTNLGKNQMYQYNDSTEKSKLYRRTSSLPAKMVLIQDRMLVLNSDGSISWFNPLSQTALADWYFTIDNEWVEF